MWSMRRLQSRPRSDVVPSVRPRSEPFQVQLFCDLDLFGGKPAPGWFFALSRLPTVHEAAAEGVPPGQDPLLRVR